MTEFTPVLSATGGILIGLASVMLMAALGRIAGISGIRQIYQAAAAQSQQPHVLGPR